MRIKILQKTSAGMRNWLAIGLALFLVSQIGCQGSGIERVAVDGTVTLDGQPLEEAQIMFLPTGDTKAPVSGAAITAGGKYKVMDKGGVPVGTHKVSIKALRKKPGAPDRGALTPVIDIVPTKYNKRSELTVTIESGSGAVTKNFELFSAQ